MKKTEKLPTLESSLAEISELIEKMEQSDQTLEQSLTHFERGITLIKHCQKILGEAEQKVQQGQRQGAEGTQVRRRRLGRQAAAV